MKRWAAIIVSDNYTGYLAGKEQEIGQAGEREGNAMFDALQERADLQCIIRSAGVNGKYRLQARVETQGTCLSFR